MQSLPDVPADRRADAAALFLARQKKFDDAERSSIVQQVQAVLADPRFAALFGPGSRAEVSITGRLDGRPVAGQVDRLVVTPDRGADRRLQVEPAAAARASARRSKSTAATSSSWRSTGMC